MLQINKAFMTFQKRAENTARDTLIETFVAAEPLSTLLRSLDHQIVYGRRGTGKTHAFGYVASKCEEDGGCVVSIDLRSVGSTGGIYGDPGTPLPERATRLLVDLVEAVHEQLLGFAVANAEELNLHEAGPKLDALADANSQVKVTGEVTSETASGESAERSRKSGSRMGIEQSAPAVIVEDGTEAREAESASRRRVVQGRETYNVIFGELSKALGALAKLWAPRRIWILLDEWSSVPLDLQPYLADFVRRSLFPVGGVTVKIAAIEARSRFLIRRTDRDYIGIEVGADAAANVNLDDFMVFDNNSDRSRDFFANLLHKHFQSVADLDLATALPTPQALVGQAFSQQPTFLELVRAAEGVPRDALNILSLAAQTALEDNIEMAHVRRAAQRWFQNDKAAPLHAHEEAEALLHWIIDEVIGLRRARAFLLQSNVASQLIEDLYDARVLHVLKRTISARDTPGVRYDVYKLDYGCYVDLLTTNKSPEGLLPFDRDDGGADYIEVPPDDYRSIRRAILDLDKFFEARVDGG